MRGWFLTIAMVVILVPQTVLAQLAVPSVRFRASGTVNGDPVSFERVEQTYFVDAVSEASDASGIRNRLNIGFGNNLGTDIFRWNLEFAMPEGQPLAPGTYPTPKRSIGGRGTSAFMSISSTGSNVFGCPSTELTVGRSFTLEEVTLDDTGFPQSASFAFVEVCTTAELSGTIVFQRDGDFGDDDGGGDTPPVEPPAPFQIEFPIEFDIEPVLVSNGATQTLEFSTAVSGEFNSDLHLFVETDALEHEDFHASITPNVVPSPGIGDAELTISTGPLTFPRVYSVKLIASANDQRFERTFLVQVLCDPPFILGTSQPKSISAANGSQVTLEVTPNGTGPFFYQWYKGMPGMTRNPVLAANDSKLIFTTRETAAYWVRVSNACGTVNSGSATVTTTGTLTGPARRRGAGS